MWLDWVGIMALGTLMVAGSVYWDLKALPTVAYGCKRLDTTEDGACLIHCWAGGRSDPFSG
jgi:hypothetical protein